MAASKRLSAKRGKFSGWRMDITETKHIPIIAAWIAALTPADEQAFGHAMDWLADEFKDHAGDWLYLMGLHAGIPMFSVDAEPLREVLPADVKEQKGYFIFLAGTPNIDSQHLWEPVWDTLVRHLFRETETETIVTEISKEDIEQQDALRNLGFVASKKEEQSDLKVDGSGKIRQQLPHHLKITFTLKFADFLKIVHDI